MEKFREVNVSEGLAEAMYASGGILRVGRLRGAIDGDELFIVGE